tara:strand:+ start:50 stop:982 length:933 start_codon:yes stop_codon:yes gene_type:complete
MAAEHQRQVKGTTNASTLVEKIVRQRIYRTTYWNERCLGLNEETLVDRAVELNHVGGTYGGSRRPTDFLCLVLKMLQMKPDPEIVLEFIRQKDQKYARALGCYYWRLTAKPQAVYQELEPLLTDYRKLRVRDIHGYKLITIDSFVEELLMQTHSCHLSLPTIPPRATLERAMLLEPRISLLQEEYDMSVEMGKKPWEKIAEVSRKRSANESSMSSTSSSSSSTVKRARVEKQKDLGAEIVVLVNDRLGKKERIPCREHNTVGEFKLLIQQKTGTRSDKIRLQKWHSILKDNIMLSDYEVHDGMSLEMYYN